MRRLPSENAATLVECRSARRRVWVKCNIALHLISFLAYMRFGGKYLPHFNDNDTTVTVWFLACYRSWFHNAYSLARGGRNRFSAAVFLRGMCDVVPLASVSGVSGSSLPSVGRPYNNSPAREYWIYLLINTVSR